MAAHVHQIIGSFWNAAEMKRQVNRTCFHAGFTSQSGICSFRLSCELTLTENIKTIDKIDQIDQNKVQYNLETQVGNISTSSSENVGNLNF